MFEYLPAFRVNVLIIAVIVIGYWFFTRFLYRLESWSCPLCSYRLHYHCAILNFNKRLMIYGAPQWSRSYDIPHNRHPFNDFDLKFLAKFLWCPNKRWQSSVFVLSSKNGAGLNYTCYRRPVDLRLYLPSFSCGGYCQSIFIFGVRSETDVRNTFCLFPHTLSCSFRQSCVRSYLWS